MRTARALLGVAGAALLAFGVVSAFTSPHMHLGRQAIYAIAVLLLHDAVLAPMFLAAGAVTRRWVPAPYRAVVQGGLLVTAAVTFVALPFVLGFGRIADNPSALPRNYTGGYLLVLAAIWAVAGALLIRRRWAGSSRG